MVETSFIDNKAKILLTIAGSLTLFVIALLITVLDLNIYASVGALVLSMLCGWGICSIGYLLGNRWISVEKELPPKNGRYLANLNGSVVAIVPFYNGKWQDSDKADYITHWMPVPHKPRPEC